MLRSNAYRSRLFCWLVTLLLLPSPSTAGLADLSDNPLSSATTSQVKPNILFVLDDSGSMIFRFMPDALSSRDTRIGIRNNLCNRVYYNPSVNYVIPRTSTNGDVNSGTPTAFTAAYIDGYFPYYTGGSSATTNLGTSFQAFISGSESFWLSNWSSFTNQTSDAAQPAYYWKYLGATTLVPLTGDCENGLGYTISNATYASGVATYTTSTGHAVAVGESVTISGVSPSGYRGTFAIASVPSATTFTVAMGSNPGAFTGAGTALVSSHYSTITEYCTDGSLTKTTCAAAAKTARWRKIVVSSTSGPATVDINGDGAVNASDRDERQNFANWYSYYRNRLNIMKSAAGRAFVGMSDAKRIGFITINPGSPVTAGKFKTIADFDTTQKSEWFDKLYAQRDSSGGTPLRLALSRAGRYFAGKTDGINNGMSGDPVQYSCQQNFTIFTTDGYWNGAGGEKLDGTTNMDNQDGVISEQDIYRAAGDKYTMSPRPIFDGASTTYNWNTATSQSQTAVCAYGTSPQQRTRQYQTCSSPSTVLEARTSSNATSSSAGSWSGYSSYAGTVCEDDAAGSSIRQCRNGTVTATRTSSDSGASFGSWTATGSCTADFTSTSRRECRRTAPYSSCAGTWSNSLCANTDTTTLPYCRSSAGAWADVASCTPAAQDAGGAEIECQTVNVNGTKLQYQTKAYTTVYSGPNQGGSILVAKALYETGAWTDVTPATCYLTPPAVPALADVTGSGPPTPPANCSGGSQVWPCETTAAGAGGLVVNVSSAAYTAAGFDPTTEPSTATYTTSVSHQFLVGHTVTIAGMTPSAYNGTFEIVAVPEEDPVTDPVTHFHFKVNLLVANPGASTAGGTATLFAGSSNSLSDVAQYYYKTDLRTTALGNCTGALGGTTDVCADNVPSTGSGVEDDRANWQHMTTFTMGLGLTGTVVYSPSYKTDQCVARTISDATWASNVVTVTTSVAHGFYANEAVTMAGGNVAGYRGQFRIATVPSSTTFTYALTTNPGGAFGSGTATGCPDFARIRSGNLNWPVPAAEQNTALDDLWHAAVNGRGQYFGAGDPDTVVTSLSEALAGINARVAAAAAAATSNLEPVAGDNFAYTAKYKTQSWTGDLEAREIDLTTGAVSGTVIWSAQAKLDALTKSACDNRSIKLFRSGGTDNMVDFKWNTYACDAGGAPTGVAATTLDASEQTNFNATKVALLSHYPNLGNGAGATVDQRTPAAGANLVNYLRGQRGKEGFSSGPPVTNTDVNTLYRTRENVLGDIINAQPVFVKTPFAEYDDTGYAVFKSTHASRTPMVYSAANDGMLHAVYAGASIVDTNGGNEAWAFIPTMVLPNIYKLASENYATEHTYSVDGTPSAGDVYDPQAIDPVSLVVTPSWKTILVSGLNKGGKGYYALDVTDPAAPKALWEFKHDVGNCVTVDATTKAPATDQYSDCHLGYSFNNPIISKLRDGRWVVFVTSGYNNVNSPAAAGDGLGYLYVLEAMTGKILYKISTGVGSSTDPSGLNHISGWADNALRNNQTERVYGVDLKGNVWRFDINDILNAAGREATRIATVVDASDVAQPITTRPELAEVQGETFVYVATGRYLGTSDLSDTQTQSVWALRDTLSATALTNLRTSLRKMVITNHGSGTSAFRTIGCTAQCGSADGWFADLPDTGERVNIDMKLQLGTLVVASNVPESNACNIGGYAWLNYFNNATGEAIVNSADSAVGRRLVGAGGQESLAVGLNIVRLPSGKTVVIATTSAAQQLTVEAPFDVAPPTGKRVSWREILQ